MQIITARWCSGYTYPDSSWMGANLLGKEWYRYTETESDEWSNSYGQVPFGISNLRLVIGKLINNKKAPVT